MKELLNAYRLGVDPAVLHATHPSARSLLSHELDRAAREMNPD